MKSLNLSKPHAIVTVGIAGSGKTQFLEKFSETFKAPYISEEAIRTVTSSKGDIGPLLWYVIDQLAKTDATILLDIDTSSRSKRVELSKRLKEAGYSVLFVWLQTDPETSFQRTTKQRQTSKETFEAALRHFSPPHPLENALVLSGKHTYASQAKIVLKRLAVPRPAMSARPVQPNRGQIIIR